jgi:hypothetical protein
MLPILHVYFHQQTDDSLQDEKDTQQPFQLWDDRTKRHIRVIADLSTGTRGFLLGFIPAFSSDVSDEFILTPDGMFLGE